MRRRNGAIRDLLPARQPKNNPGKHVRGGWRRQRRIVRICVHWWFLNACFRISPFAHHR